MRNVHERRVLRLVEVGYRQLYRLVVVAVVVVEDKLIFKERKKEKRYSAATAAGQTVAFPSVLRRSSRRRRRGSHTHTQTVSRTAPTYPSKGEKKSENPQQ